MRSRPLPAALLLALVAQALFCWRLTTPHMLVFDEIHYVPAARQLWALAAPANIEHPPLGKLLIGLGMAAFGDNPLGWRAMSTLAGTATVLALYAIGWLVFGRVRTALLCGLFGLLNFTLLVQARIAMLDGFMAALVVGGVVAMLWAMRGVGAQVWRRWLGGAVLLGLAAGCKWVAVPYIAFAGVGVALARHRAPWRWPGLGIARAWTILGLASVTAYLLTFAPTFFYAYDPMTPATLLPFQLRMWVAQTQVLPHHPYQSAWYTWPFDIRPIWYLYEATEGAQRGILMLGNPAIMWGGLVAVGLCLRAGLRERSAALGGVAALWLGGFAMWAIVPKSLGFFYYYYLPSLWLPVAIAAAFDRYGRGRWRGWDEMALILAGVLFVWFYPILSAGALSGPRAFTHWMWFASWI